ncbi:MAG TPA: hypothetical protein VF388_02335 [Lacunisphaera sp.]
MNAKKAQIITTEKLAALKAELEALPERKQQTKRTIVDEMSDEIAAAVDRGYTYAQIADMLRTKGVKIAAGTLQRYMRQAGVIQRKGRK